MNNCVDIDIMQYEYLIDLERANQQIYEECIGEKIVSLESGSVVQEGKIISTVLKVIKTIFDKLVDFLKNIVSTFKKMQNTNLKVNQSLIKACENKAKNMSAEDRRTFSIKKALYSDSMRKFVEFMNENNLKVGETLKKFMGDLDAYMKDTSFTPNLDSDIESIEQIDKEYDRLSNPVNLRSDLTDINFDDIQDILAQYKRSAKPINVVKLALKTSENTANECKNRIDTLIKNDSYESPHEHLPKFKEAIYKASNLVIKICGGIISITKEMFTNYENILHAFVNWNANTESFYFEDEYKLYLL